MSVRMLFRYSWPCGVKSIIQSLSIGSINLL
nr:MAG TPA: hypothetical protein [Caudoviricetes sp.]DAT10699.1 MAG TPA: hypothetical protein [Caudoviricetes sp.]